MKRFYIFLSTCALLATPGVAQEVRDPPILDLTPTWLEENINPGILDSLVDPDSAKIEWKYSTVLENGTEKLPNASGKKVKTKVRFASTCGTINAKNRMGGYTGKLFVIVALWPTRLVVNYEELGSDNGVRGTCQSRIRSGKIVPR